MNVTYLPVGQTHPVNEKLAGVVPMASPQEQESLNEDVARNGLREPVILFRGEVIDGRCRQIACKLAGVPISCKSLDDNLTEELVESYVKSVNTRRNLTMGQKIMVASKTSRRPGAPSLAVTAKAWGIGKTTLVAANFIAKHRPDFVEPLFNGSTVSILNIDGNSVITNKISAIHAYVRREVESTKEVPTKKYDWSATETIFTQAGKDWFFGIVKRNKGVSVEVMQELANRANDKFPPDPNGELKAQP